MIHKGTKTRRWNGPGKQAGAVLFLLASCLCAFVVGLSGCGPNSLNVLDPNQAITLVVNIQVAPGAVVVNAPINIKADANIVINAPVSVPVNIDAHLLKDLPHAPDANTLH
jgi:hypothetical protein